VIQFIAGLVVTPFVVKNLGENYFSLWVVFLTWISFEGFILLGTPQALLRFVPFYLGKKEARNLNSLVRTYLVFYGLIAFLTGVALLLSYDFLFRYFDLPQDLYTTYTDSLKWMYFGLVLSIFNKVFISVNNGQERFVFYNSVLGLSIILRLLIIILFIEKGFIILPIAYFASQVFIGCLMLYSYFKSSVSIYKDFTFGDFNNDVAVFKTGLFFGMASLLMYVSDILRHQLDTLIILKNVDLASITHYKIGTTLITAINGLSAGLFSVILVRLSFHKGSSNEKHFNELSLRSYFYSSLLGTYFILGISLLSPEFLTLWMGEYDQRSLHIIYILLIPQLLMLTQYPSINIMYSVGQQKTLGLLTLLESLINFVISLILVKKIGIEGVVIGTGVGFILSKGLVMPFLLKRYCRLSLKAQVAQSLPHFLIGGASYGALYFILSSFKFSLLSFNFLIKCAVITIVFFSFIKIYYFIFPKDEAEILSLAGMRRVFK
jgi:O-antigen/teichoic acid export membrane protein